MEPRDGGSTAGFSASTREVVQAKTPRETPGPIPCLTILCHPDLDRIGERALLTELVRGREVLLSRQQPFFSAPDAAKRAQALEDRFLSRSPLRITSRPDGVVHLSRNYSRTTALVDGQPLDDLRALDVRQLDEGVVLELARRIVLLLHRLSRLPDSAPPRFGLVGDSDGIVQVRRTIERIAELDVPVLLRGATGTGKELVARALHEGSPRREQPFVSVNLGALTPSLATSELFGASRGAYTGADRDQPGYFVAAHRGTLFLDEIGEAPPEVQVMLLRVLETREVLPVGSQRPKRVDLRLVSATDGDLDSLVHKGGFRAPLLHRLMSYTMYMPALCERRDDIGRLLVHFLRLERKGIGEPPPPSDPEESAPWLPAPLVSRLARYRWPGNVRQLRNVARQLVIDSIGQPQLDLTFRLEALLQEAGEPPGDPVDEDETLSMTDTGPVRPAENAPARSRRRKPSEVSEEELVAALDRHRYEAKATAEDLGVSRTSLYALLKRSPNVRSAADVPPEDVRRAFERFDGDVKAMVDELRISERALRQRLKDLGLR